VLTSDCHEQRQCHPDCDGKVVDDSGCDQIKRTMVDLEGRNLVDSFPTESCSLDAECYVEDDEEIMVLRNAADTGTREIKTPSEHDTMIGIRRRCVFLNGSWFHMCDHSAG